jgi:hypothetical protein
LKIAILGWGSLIWDPRPEFDKFHEDWLCDGPELKLEFSRISESRKRALTLVIDEQCGGVCRVAYAFSKRKSLNDAVCDLRCREGTILERIGFTFVGNGSSGEPHVPGTIRPWAAEKKIDAVVWTGLQSNFQSETQKPFSIPEALTHLKELPADGKAKAAEYVWRAPMFVRTPLRSALEVEPWFPHQDGAQK